MCSAPLKYNSRARDRLKLTAKVRRQGGVNSELEQPNCEDAIQRHEGGVEPLALSCSTDLKSAPRTDEDHHGLAVKQHMAGAAAEDGARRQR